MKLLLAVILLILGFVMLIKGADWFVDGAAGIAARFGIPQLVIGLTIVAMGTSSPELAVSVSDSVASLSSGANANMALGNVVGSNIFNILFILGITSLITPLGFAPSFLIDTLFSLACAVLLLVLSLNGGKLKRWGGIIMLASYAVYFVYLCATQLD